MIRIDQLFKKLMKLRLVVIYKDDSRFICFRANSIEPGIYKDMLRISFAFTFIYWYILYIKHGIDSS